MSAEQTGEFSTTGRPGWVRGKDWAAARIPGRSAHRPKAHAVSAA